MAIMAVRVQVPPSVQMKTVITLFTKCYGFSINDLSTFRQQVTKKHHFLDISLQKTINNNSTIGNKDIKKEHW